MIHAIVAFGAFVMLVWSAGLYYLLHTYKVSELAHAGQLGDTFGIFNSLFSGLAFAGVLLSLFIQHRGLSGQAQSVVLQQRALAAQQLTLEQQSAELASQRNEFQKSAKTQALGMHIGLLSLGMQDDELGKVWVRSDDDDIREIKQTMYVSLIVEQWKLLVLHGLMTPARLKENIDSNMRSPIFQKFWAGYAVSTTDAATSPTQEETEIWTIFAKAYATATKPVTPPRL